MGLMVVLKFLIFTVLYLSFQAMSSLFCSTSIMFGTGELLSGHFISLTGDIFTSKSMVVNFVETLIKRNLTQGITHTSADMGGVEWAMWANENAIASSLVTVVGGILAVIGQYHMWAIGIYAIIVGLLSLLVEYPRSKRRKGKHDHERSFQYPATAIVKSGGLFTRNYFIRFVFYLVISVPCCFILQTVLGAVCFMVTGFIYLTAGVKGEEWQPILRKEAEQGPRVIAEPTRPPPRRPDNASIAGSRDNIASPHDSRV